MRLYTGNDGGSIPTRRELVREGAKEVTTTKVKELQSERQEHFWMTCALSHEPLQTPVVSDGLGTLYNKAAVLDHLLSLSQENLNKESLAKRGEAFKDRIRSLKDVVEVRFQQADGASTTNSKWICPITHKTLGPGTKSIYIVPCGHAFAESLVKEMKGDTCLECDEIYTQINVIPILPTLEEEKDRLEQRLSDLKAEGLSHSLKKATSSGKKRRKDKGTEVDSTTEDALSRNKQYDTKADGIKNPDTAELTARVLGEQERRNKKRKMDANVNIQSLFSSKHSKDGGNADFMTRGYSIPAGDGR